MTKNLTVSPPSDLGFEMDWGLADAPDQSVTTAPTAPPLSDSLVSQASAGLIGQERAIAHEFGFEHDDSQLFYAAGTQLADVGMSKAREFAMQYAALPSIGEAATLHAATIAAEFRKDRFIKPAEWRLNAHGKLAHHSGDFAAGLSDTAWSQLGARQADISPTPPSEARSQAINAPRGNFNAWLGHAAGESKVRVRTQGDDRQIFAVLSSGSRGYVAYDSDRVLYDLARAMPDTKCELQYDAATTRLKVRAYIQARIDITAFVGVGRVHRAGVQFVTRDDGMMSLQGQAFLERTRCRNHTLVTETRGTIRRKHTGTFAQLQGQLMLLVGRMPEMIANLQALWQRAATEYYLDSESGLKLDAPEAIARLVLNGHIPTGGLDEQEAIDAYVQAWRAEESPHSAAGIVMAVQRAAHETAWKTRWATDEIEEQASTMLSQRVYTLAESVA